MSTQVEIFKADAWVNISAANDAYVEGDEQVSITDHGRDADTGTTSVGQCTVRLDNTGNKYSPRNPASPNYGLIGRNTKIRVSNGTPIPVNDTFTRTVSNGWGTADVGGAWTDVGGSASDRSVNGTQGIITLPATITTERIQYAGGVLTDIDVVTSMFPGQVSTGNSLHGFVVLRYNTGTGAGYRCRVTFTTSSTVTLELRDASTQLATATTGLSYTANQEFKVRARVVRDTIYLRIWRAGVDLEPALWHIAYRVTSGLLTSGRAGLGYVATSGNTNTTPSVKYDNTQVTDLSTIRFCGEVPNWASRWSERGSNAWIPVEAAGVRRRLEKGRPPLKSVLHRQYTGILTPDPVAYWPCEDAVGATSVGSAMGGSSMKITGTPTFGAYDGFACSDALPTMGTARFTGTVPTHVSLTNEIVRMLFYQPTAITGSKQILGVRASGNAGLWQVVLDASGNLTLKIYNSDQELKQTNGPYSFGVNGQQCELRLQLIQVGVNTSIDWELGIRYITGATSSALVQTGNISAATLGEVLGSKGTVTSVSIAYDQNLPDLVAGHVVVANTTTVFDALLPSTSSPLVAWQGETAGRRIERLCTEEGIPFAGVGDLADSELLGAQRPGNLLDLLQEAADADNGILFETRYEPGLSYRTRSSIYSQSPVAALDYSQEHLSPPFEPVEDDSFTRNDVTVERVGGGSARATLDSGSMSTSDVGTYEDQVSLSLYLDSQCQPQAQWRVYTGTIDEPRFQTLTVDPMSNPSIQAAVAQLDCGDRVTISNPPPPLPPGTIDVIIQGYSESFDGIVSWLITFNCTPGSPWRVATLDDAILGRADTAGSTLATGAATGTGAGTAATKDYIVVPDADATGFAVGNLVQLYTSAGATKEATTFTVTAKNSAFGFTNISYTPNSQDFTVSGDQVRRVDQTSLSVATSTGPLWITGSSSPDFPFDVRLSVNGTGGEVVTVTAVSGSTSPQTFTVTRATNGARRGWPAGTDIRLAQPMIVAL